MEFENGVTTTLTKIYQKEVYYRLEIWPRSATCWYSNLVYRSPDLIEIFELNRILHPKYWSSLIVTQNNINSKVIVRYLGSHWSDLAQTFFIESRILIHQQWVLWRIKKFHFFFNLTLLEGALESIFWTQKLYFTYFIVMEALL